jgi:hypothetical protein
MPFVVTRTPPIPTEPYCARSSDWCDGDQTCHDPDCKGRVSRVATATLKEAHDTAREACLYAPGSVETIAQAVRDVFALPESGGTVGPLPDGSLIEVERVTFNRLAADAAWIAPENDRDYSSAPRHAEQVIAAFNEANR